MKLLLIATFVLTCSGCAFVDYVDWHGVWFGCPKGQVKKPAVLGMFGMVKYPSYCEKAEEPKEERP